VMECLLLAINGHPATPWIMSALPPKADLFQHRRLCLLLTQSGHLFDDAIQQVWPIISDLW